MHGDIVRPMLPRGSRIAVVAPSGAFDDDRLAAGLAVLESWGHHPKVLPGARSRWRYLAGDDETRLADLLAAFTGPFDAVWMARGGYGLLRLLPLLPVPSLRLPFLGFSDGTALLNPLALAGGAAVHAPVLTQLGTLSDPESRSHLRALLEGTEDLSMEGTSLVPGAAAGRLAGGNLCTLATLCGTPWQLDARGAIVVLEDTGETPYRVDRLLTQLLVSGAFAGAVGFALGEFDRTPSPEAGFTLTDVFLDRLGGLGVPILVNLPIGHGPRNHAFPFGPARMIGTRLSF